VLGIAAHVREGQDGDRRLVGWFSIIRETRSSRARQTYEAVSATWRGYDVALSVLTAPQRFSKSRYLNLEIVFFDDQAGPHCIHELVFRDEISVRCHKNAKNTHCSATESNHCAIAQKFTSLKIEAEWAETHLFHGIQARISVSEKLNP